MGKLPALQELWLDYNQLQSVLSETDQLDNLTYLDPTLYKIECLSEEIADLEILTSHPTF